MGTKLQQKAIARSPAAIGQRFGQKASKPRPLPWANAVNGHQLVTGISRMGKSKLLEKQGIADMVSKELASVIFIDSHASTASAVLHACIRLGIPPDRVILIDLTRPEYGVPRIWLYDALPGMEYIVVDGLVACFREIWGKGIQDRAADILTQLGLTLQKAVVPFTDANRFLMNARFRAEVLEKCNDQSLNDFWEHIYGMRNREIIESSRNKLNAIIGHTLIRPMFSDTFNSFSLFDALQAGKIIIVNLDHAYFGLYSRGMLGSIFLFLIYQAVIQRKPTQSYTPIRLYLDEFHEYAVPEFYLPYFTASAKYNVGINIYTQTLDRFDAYDLNTILGNVGVITSFGVSHKDATVLTPNMLTPFGEMVRKQKRDIYSILGFDRGYGEATYYSTGEEERNFHHELMNQKSREIMSRIKGTDQIALYYGNVTEAMDYKVSEEEEHEYRLESAKGICLPVEAYKPEPIEVKEDTPPPAPPKRAKWKKK